jgi:hypothetical protein
MRQKVGLMTLLSGALVCVAVIRACADELKLDLIELSSSPAKAGLPDDSILGPKPESLRESGSGNGLIGGLHELRISAGPTIGLAHIFGHNNHTLAFMTGCRSPLEKSLHRWTLRYSSQRDEFHHRQKAPSPPPLCRHSPKHLAAIPHSALRIPHLERLLPI